MQIHKCMFYIHLLFVSHVNAFSLLLSAVAALAGWWQLCCSSLWSAASCSLSCWSCWQMSSMIMVMWVIYFELSLSLFCYWGFLGDSLLWSYNILCWVDLKVMEGFWMSECEGFCIIKCLWFSKFASEVILCILF